MSLAQFFLFLGAIAALAASFGIVLRQIWLFQLKEWRWDRLREHLRREGWIRSLYGRSTALLYTAWIISALVFGFLEQRWLDGSPATIILLPSTLLLILVAASILLPLLRSRHRLPVPTAKALSMGMLTVLMSACTLAGLFWIAPRQWHWILACSPLLQTPFLLASWILLRPVDVRLKRRLMHRASAKRRSMPTATVIGIAGSVGKTTTKELLSCVLTDLHPLVTPKHVNTELGVAQWLCTRDLDAHTLIIAEMGAYTSGEIKILGQILQPTIGVMTALGSDHLALFGSEEAIIAANAELLESLPADGHLFLNGLNEASASLSSCAHCAVTITQEPSTIDTNKPTLCFTYKQTQFAVPLHGAHNIQNVLLAIEVGCHLGIALDRIAALLRDYTPMPHTFQVRMQQQVMLLDDTYNISPLSMKAALDWLRVQPQRPRILLTSGLLELGEKEDVYLREMGAYASGAVESVVYTTSRGMHAFAENCSAPVSLLDTNTPRIPPGGILACVGRMDDATMQRMLPLS